MIKRVSNAALPALMLFGMLLASPSDGKMKYHWTLQTDQYAVSISKPIGLIPYQDLTGEMLGRGNEAVFAGLAAAGFPLFRRMRDEQGGTIWFQCRIDDVGDAAEYDGALGSMVLDTTAGDSVRVSQLLASPINSFAGLTPVPLVVLVRGVPWDRMRCAARSGEAWILFAGFPRVFDPREIRGFRLGKE